MKNFILWISFTIVLYINYLTFSLGHLEVLRKLVTHSGAHLANDKDNTGNTISW